MSCKQNKEKGSLVLLTKTTYDDFMHRKSVLSMPWTILPNVYIIY